MSLMNLQKLRQICYLNQRGYPEMNITLPPNDPLNRVEFADYYGRNRGNHTAQVNSINTSPESYRELLEVRYSTEEDIDDLDEMKMRQFNLALARAFFSRLNQILVEHGFHSRYLPTKHYDYSYDPFVVMYVVPSGLMDQVDHACYNDGRSMRKAVEFQAYLNKHGVLPPEEID